MAEPGFFPHPGDIITFEEPEPSNWTVVTELDQQSFQKTNEDFKYWAKSSYACATFLVRNNSKDQVAFMRIYMQVPNKGTEFSRPEDRAKQAASASGRHKEFEAMKAFYEGKSTITPAFLGWKVGFQDDQSPVPGGYVIRFVFERVPGVRLADNRILPGQGRPLPTFFREFDEKKRKQIRNDFNKGYRKLKELGWVPYSPWATNLIWDDKSSKLYFVDFRDPHTVSASYKGSGDFRNPYTVNVSHEDSGSEEPEKKEALERQLWKRWGLAFGPPDPKQWGDDEKWTL